MAAPHQFIRGYELQEELGRGGFGVVYRATQTILKREVALKAILPQYANEPDFIRRFEREAEIVASLEHPYIVPLFDYWRDPDGAFLVMRFIRGGSLHSMMKKGALDPAQVINIFDNIGSALHLAHRKGVTHRDIKPANILLDEEGNAYLTDFGIAKSPHYQSETGAGMKGTLSYAAPEQLQQGDIGPHTDIHAMGIVLYEALAGTHPFADMDTTQLIFAVLQTPLPDIGDILPELPSAFNSIIQRATAKAPAERYASMRDMLDDLRAAQSAENRAVSAPDTDATFVALDNPYKGLRAFQEHDHTDFYGRDVLTDDLLRRLELSADRFLAVVGPSGSGKSSVVRAGMVPRLRKGAIASSDNWFIVEMFPGSKPFVELEAALLRIAASTPNNLLQILRDEDGIARALKQILPNESDQLLLVIDQFEELFTLVESEDARAQFIDNLLDALQDARGHLRVIVTIRADFLDRPLYYDDLGNLFRKNTELIVPFSPAELDSAIRQPAESIGAVLETGLVERIIQDVQDQPGALPLLQYALMELFEQRRGRVIPLAAYDTIGGVIGAVGKRADEVYQTLSANAQTTARQLFLRLVTLGEGTEDTRRRVRREEIAGLPIVDEVLDAFGRARLLTFDYDPVSHEPTLEVAHEALIRNWDTLREWLKATREDLRILARLRQAANEWLTAEQETSYLASGSRLQEYKNWVDNTSLELSADESNYLTESIAHEAALYEREEARKAEEERIARRAQNFQRASIGLAVMVVAALIAVVAAISTSIGASNQAATATVAQGEALALGATVRADSTQLAADTSYFALQQDRLATLAVGGVVLPPGTGTPEPTQYVATLTAVAALNDWEPVEMTDQYGAVMVQVPPGCFYMGGVTSRNEQPVHIQCFDEPYWIDKYEVTNAQYQQITGADPPSEFADDLNPVDSINWFDARDYCALRGARLPTEREWEYAARGPDSLNYPWGSDFLDDATVYAIEASLPVVDAEGKPRRPNGTSWVGAIDMLGNLWEWTSTIYHEYDQSLNEPIVIYTYPYVADDGRERDETLAEFNARLPIATARVQRGASWFDNSTWHRTAVRWWEDSSATTNYSGFRCARSF